MNVRVPATSANLACGFDTCGIAVNLYNTFTCTALETDEIIINNYRNTQANKSNLTAVAFYQALQALGKPPCGIEIKITSQVPLSRGLGSSATCIVAGIAAAYTLTNTPLDNNEILRLAAAIEGHGDNVAPAIWGGACICYQKEKTFRQTAFSVHKRYHFDAIIPYFPLATSKARKQLPDAYPRSDVVFNLSRCALLPLAFERGDDTLLHDALDDRIHQPFRKPLIENYAKIESIIEQCGYVGQYLSGAGPTIMAVANDETKRTALENKIKQMDARYEVYHLEIEKDGMCIF